VQARKRYRVSRGPGKLACLGACINGADENWNGCSGLAGALQGEGPLVQIFGGKQTLCIRTLEQSCSVQPRLGGGRTPGTPYWLGNFIGNSIDFSFRFPVGLPGLTVEAETISLARHVSDGTVHTAFMQHGAQRAYGPLERIVCDRNVGPDDFQKLILGNDPTVVVDKINQQIEYARLQWDFLPRAHDNAARFIKLEGSKFEGHVVVSALSRKGSDKDQEMISPR
jgi:hypothetical protein